MLSLIEYGGCSNPGQVQGYFATRLLKSFELLLTLLSLGVRRVFKPAGAIGVFNTSTKMEAYHEDKFAETTERLLKLRRNPNKMDVIRRLQGHFVGRKISHLLESPSLSFRISSEETEESTQHMCTKLGDAAAELLQEHHQLLQHRGSVNGLLGTGAP